MTPEMPGFLDMTRSDGFEDPFSWILMILDSRMLDFEGFGSFLIPVLKRFSFLIACICLVLPLILAVSWIPDAFGTDFLDFT